ncbi:MAG: alpha/beta hydrolase [Planctomycetaceae bacterium]
MPHELDPELAIALRQAASLGLSVPDYADIREARRVGTILQQQWHAHFPDAREIYPLETHLDGERVPSRVYVPAEDDQRSVVLFIHGGGWSMGDFDGYNPLMRGIAAACHAPIMFPDYALAPEHPFPRGLGQLREIIRRLNSEQYPQFTGRRLVVAGDSSGANMALAALRGSKPFLDADALVLIYGVFDKNMETDSYREFGGGQFGLSRAGMNAFYRHYTSGDNVAPDDPRLSPLHSDLAGLPPTHITIAGLDCLRDDSLKLANKLAILGNDVETNHVQGVVHGFLRYGRAVTKSESAIGVIGDFVRRMGRR